MTIPTTDPSSPRAATENTVASRQASPPSPDAVASAQPDRDPTGPRQAIESRTARLAVIGLGYVGLPLVELFANQGFRVTGFDIDASKIELLEAGQSYIGHISSQRIADLRRMNRFEATCDFRRLADCDVIMICVPTPLGLNREPDLSMVISTGRSIAQALRPGQLIILESTTYPGTTRDVLRPVLEESGLTAGVDFFLGYSPEREDPGNPRFSTGNIPKVVGGFDPASRELAVALYGAVVPQVIAVSSCEAAEACKILENTYRAVNIALVNELKIVFDRMGIDVWEVIDAAKTKPFGFQAFYPGPGLGGHCIPIDPFYLTWKAKEFGQRTRFIELAGEINNGMPHYVVERVAGALNEERKPLKGANVLIVGLAYKPNIDDSRETPAAEIITLLEDRGAAVSYHDPHVPVFPRMRKYKYELRSIPLNQQTVAAADVVVIVTNHDAVDYTMLGRHARLIVDSRNAMHAVRDAKARIVQA